VLSDKPFQNVHVNPLGFKVIAGRLKDTVIQQPFSHLSKMKVYPFYNITAAPHLLHFKSYCYNAFQEALNLI